MSVGLERLRVSANLRGNPVGRLVHFVVDIVHMMPGMARQEILPPARYLNALQQLKER